MVISDPYAALGVTRTASREEIARAYRALVKRSHPDTGAPTTPAEMARINAAWRILGDPLRRARWDREHTIAADAPPWTAPVVRPQSASREPPAPPSRMDSGPMVAGIIAAIGFAVVGVMIGVFMIAGPSVQTTPFAAGPLSFDYPDSWSLTSGELSPTDERWVVAHLTSFPTAADERCMAVGERCRWEGEALPAGGASVQVIAWESGQPPDPEPDQRFLIGGEPSSRAQTTIGDEYLSAWWQLSPPGFPDRWIEVRAEIRGGDLDRSRRMAQVDALLESVEFGPSP